MFLLQTTDPNKYFIFFNYLAYLCIYLGQNFLLDTAEVVQNKTALYGSYCDKNSNVFSKKTLHEQISIKK